jgi:hypothetical protein
MLHGYHGDDRFEWRLESAEGDTKTFLAQSRKFLGELRFIALSLDNLEQVIKALEEMARTAGVFQQDSATRYLEEQRSLWTESLVRDFRCDSL